MSQRGLVAVLVGLCSIGCGCGDNRSAVCGDGNIQGAEDCDDGNLDDNDDCTASCTVGRCGDGVVHDSVEECDNGERNSDQVPNACRSNCSMAKCGDGTLDAGEGCDDGNLDDGDACRQTCVSATCGDGIIQAIVEECDNGEQNSDLRKDACRLNCRRHHCGDSVPDSGEECDDGNVVDDDACRATCMAATCGDGVKYSAQEECDNGATNSDTSPDACRSGCVLAGCGDAVTDSNEECDDGNDSRTDACLPECVAATCGDGATNIGFEQCDDANTDNDDFCVDCNAAICGDGFVFVEVEACDAGTGNSDETADACRTTCELPRCGDGVADAGEICDVGHPTVSCDADCTAPACGDAQTNVAFGEACDDGGTMPGDGCGPTCEIEPGHVVFVDLTATGANNGTSWVDAFSSLHDALASTTSGEIWVADGTYFADVGVGATPDDPAATFALTSNVAVYGGFSGNEIARVQRDPTVHTTTLSGDIADSVRSEHIVTAVGVANVRLDGFTIERGLSPIGGPAIIVQSSSLVVANCTIARNMTFDQTTMHDAMGGAILSEESALKIERSNLTSNVASFAGGNLTSSARGGAVYVRGGSLAVQDSAFTDNSTFTGSRSEGGAIYSKDGELRIARVDFTSNGAIGSPALGRGGAVQIEAGTRSYIYNSTFVANRSSGLEAEGGAISMNMGELVLANSLLRQNRAGGHTSSGGALHVSSAGTVEARGCTFVENMTGITTGTGHPYYGGAAYVATGASITVMNTAFQHNESLNGEDIYCSMGCDAMVTYSCMQTMGWGPGTQIPTVLFMLLPPGQTNYRLASNSTCIDAGTNLGIAIDTLDLDHDGDELEPVPFDLAGRPRVTDHANPDTGIGGPPVVDVGAYEKP